MFLLWPVGCTRGLAALLQYERVSVCLNRARLKQLHQRQIRVLEWVDRALEALFDSVPPNTYITITSDHGELFGEGDYFGHGPINHEKVLEVPFVEGKLR